MKLFSLTTLVCATTLEVTGLPTTEAYAKTIEYTEVYADEQTESLPPDNVFEEVVTSEALVPNDIASEGQTSNQPKQIHWHGQSLDGQMSSLPKGLHLNNEDLMGHHRCAPNGSYIQDDQALTQPKIISVNGESLMGHHGSVPKE
ncbi:MAG: hypothetical protein AAGI69_20415 [Cyanobacteria bacterium P01_H01_bin.21]